MISLKNSFNWAFEELKFSSLSPALDAEILLSFAIKKPKEYIYIHPEKKLTALETKNFKHLVNRRKKYEPIAYIIGYKYFYGLKFKVNKNTLIPRPETELMVEEAINLINSDTKINYSIIDVGTGTGCIPIAIAKHINRKYPIFGIDISKKALLLASQNARLNKVSKRIKFIKGNLLEPFFSSSCATFLEKSGTNMVITANLPYLSANAYKSSPKDIKYYEPRKALLGGKDGLKYYRKLFQQLNKLLLCKKKLKGVQKIYILCEIDPGQKHLMFEFIKKYLGGNVKTKKDLQGLNRLIIITLKIN